LRDWFQRRIHSFIIKHKQINDKEIFDYGLSGLIILIEKTFFLIFFSYLFNLLYEVFWLVLFYLPIRLFSFGNHFQNKNSCTLFSLIFFIGGAYLTNFSINYPTWIFLSTAFFIIIKSPQQKKRQLNKNLYRLLLILILSFYYFLLQANHFQNYILVAVILQTLLLTNILFIKEVKQ